MRDHHHGQALLLPARDVLPEADVRSVIEPLIGLVEQQNPSAAKQREGKVELLSRAARQMSRLRALADRKTELREQSAALLKRPLARQAYGRRE